MGSSDEVHLIGYRKNYLLIYKLFNFAVEWIPAVRNKAEFIFRSKSHWRYYNFWYENNKFIWSI